MRRLFAFALTALCGAAAEAAPADLPGLLSAEDAAFVAPLLAAPGAQAPANRVLTDMRAGLALFRAGRLAGAEALLADAQSIIDTIYANNPQAQQARSNFIPEKTKDFKGDPYERAMVGYYLGVIDLIHGAYDNARASFRYALLQDGMSASETYQSDMPLMQYLVGWTYWCEGSDSSAAEEFKLAEQMSPVLAAPKPGQTQITLIETGRAPRKVASGEHNEILGYQPGDEPPAIQASVWGAEGQLPAHLGEDLFFQASTRGGAAVESIRAGKAHFKQSASDVAGVTRAVGQATFGAAVASSLAGNRQGSSALLAISIAAKITSKVSSTAADIAQTQADDRAWDNLPGYLNVAVGAPAEAPRVGYFDRQGRFLQESDATRYTARRCAVAYASQQGAARRDGAVAWQAMPAYAAATQDLPIDDEGADLLNQFRAQRDATVARPTP